LYAPTSIFGTRCTKPVIAQSNYRNLIEYIK
jgi:hypothetical protein